MSIPIARGPLITGVVAAIGMGAVMMAFLNYSSPYGTFADARRTGNQAIHVAGDIRKDSIDNEPLQHIIRFTLKDQNGEVVPVTYTGVPPSDLSQATRVVAIGGFQNGTFVADRMLVKCPSKYQGESDPGASAKS